MNKSIISLFLFLFSSFIAFGQDFENYTPLVCQGDIPNDCLIRSSDKYLDESAKIDEGDFKRKESKTRKEFALEANFVLDDLLQSGLVLFDDEVSKYLNEVIQLIAKEDENLSKKNLSVYTLRSTEVNAFASDRGDVFVTLGLLAQLEDEAQLAYILSHELIHARENHSVQLFLSKEVLNKRANSKSVLQKTLFDDAMLAQCAYSKEIENEADEEGLKVFLKTNYDPSTLLTVYDVLKYSYLPFDDVPFELEFLQSEHYRFPEKYKVEEINPIVGEDEDADVLKSSHPNILSRRIALRAGLQGVNMEGRKQYLVSEKRFKHLREVARFELPMMYLHYDRLAEAIYSSYLLLKKYPENTYLKKCVVKALYMDAKIKNGSDYVIDYDPTDVEGESHQVYHLLDEMDGEETAILALHHAYNLKNKIPDDSEIEEITEDLFLELAKEKYVADDFFNEVPKIEVEKLEQEETELNKDKEASKYDRIKEKKSAQQQPEEGEYWRFAFVGETGSDEFKTAFEKALEEKAERDERDEYWESSKGRAAWRKRKKRIEKKGYALGVDKVVVVNPYFIKLEHRKETNVNYLKTESGHQNLNSLLSDMAKKTDLDVDLIDVNNLKKNDVQIFNDLRLLNDWYSEQVEHFDLSLTPGYNQSAVNEIADRYGTDYFLWTGVLSVKEIKRISGTEIFYSIILPPILPFMAAAKLTPDYDMLYYAILYDVKTRKRQVLKFDYFNRKDSNDILKAHFYDTFSQIKNKRK